MMTMIHFLQVFIFRVDSLFRHDLAYIRVLLRFLECSSSYWNLTVFFRDAELNITCTWASLALPRHLCLCLINLSPCPKGGIRNHKHPQKLLIKALRGSALSPWQSESRGFWERDTGHSRHSRHFSSLMKFVLTYWRFCSVAVICAPCSCVCAILEFTAHPHHSPLVLSTRQNAFISRSFCLPDTHFSLAFFYFVCFFSGLSSL